MLLFFFLHISDTFQGYKPINDPLSDTVPPKRTKVFVSYVYCEEGARRDSLHNLNFFLRHGARTPNDPSLLDIDYGLTVNGNCTNDQCNHPENCTIPNRQGMTPRFETLHRENSGFDFGGHTAMLHHLDEQRGKDIAHDYDAFVFLNDGVAGPFMPSYMPKDWHWVSAFLDRLRGDVGLVGTSIVCLPAHDLGGLGPKVEGYAFAMSSRALKIVQTNGTSFRSHKNKQEAILAGEYNLTTVLLNHGVQIDSLLKAYDGIDWRDKHEWGCNGQRHPTRAGSYFGTSLNPMEVLFHKAHWAGRKAVNEK